MNKAVENTKSKYSLHAPILDRNPELSISENEFENFKKAKVCLNSALALEENYDLLLNNYRELELESISAAVTEMTAMRHEYEDLFEIRTAINRRVVNLLSASRMYLDQYPQSIKKIGARIHVDGISLIHEKVRQIIAPFVEEARRLFEEAVARHEAEAKKRYPGLAAVIKEEDVVIEKIPIFLDWDDVRQKLLERNPPVGNLAKRFVTSQTKEGVKS